MKKKFIFILSFVLVCVLFTIPSFATFEITDFIIDANVMADGSMEVLEKINYYTDEEVNGLIRNINTYNPTNELNSATAIEIIAVKADGINCLYDSYAIKGEDGKFTISQSDGNMNIQVFSPFYSRNKTIEYEYILKDVAVKYEDTAEIFWNFIGEEWDSNINNLTINVNLPDMAANDNIWVFGHGADDGTFTKIENHITLYAQNIPSYNAVDARILFTKDAIQYATKNENKAVLSKYINKEEGMYKNKETKKIFLGYDVKDIAIFLDIIVIMIAVGIYLFYDKEDHIDRVYYYRDIPYNLSPEILQYIYYGKMRFNSFYVALLNLIKLGVYNLETKTNEVGKEVQVLVYNPSHTAKLKEYQSELCTSINKFLKEDEKGRQSSELLRLSKKIKTSASFSSSKLEKRLDNEKNILVGDFEEVPKKIFVFVIFVMVILILFIAFLGYLNAGIDMVCGIILTLAMTTTIYTIFLLSVSNYLPALLFVIFHASIFQIAIIMMLSDCHILPIYSTYLLMFLLIQYVYRVKKHPREERQIREYTKGLKRYLKHYSMLNKRENLDENIALWEDYFIMAIALGLNNRTINYFYNYGKEQNSNLGMSMRYTDTYTDFHQSMYLTSFNYYSGDRSSSYSSDYSSSGSSFSGSSGGFSGGSSSGGSGGGGGGGSRF